MYMNALLDIHKCALFKYVRQLIFMPWERMIDFVLFVCLSVCCQLYNLYYKFWSVWCSNFIYGMHTLLMVPFQMIPMLRVC